VGCKIREYNYMNELSDLPSINKKYANILKVKGIIRFALNNSSHTKTTM
jgi:hypothetical protein